MYDIFNTQKEQAIAEQCTTEQNPASNSPPTSSKDSDFNAKDIPHVPSVTQDSTTDINSQNITPPSLCCLPRLIEITQDTIDTIDKVEWKSLIVIENNELPLFEMLHPDAIIPNC